METRQMLCEGLTVEVVTSFGGCDGVVEMEE